MSEVERRISVPEKQPQFDIVIFGATGYTGTLVCIFSIFTFILALLESLGYVHSGCRMVCFAHSVFVSMGNCWKKSREA
jgi:hypothetical protein